jgi:hypothetical protein
MITFLLCAIATLAPLDDPPTGDDSAPVIEIYVDNVDPLEVTEHEVIYEFTIWFHDRPPLIFYSDSNTLAEPRATGYKSYEKLANGKFRLKEKRVFIINHDWVDYVEIKEIK